MRLYFIIIFCFLSYVLASQEIEHPSEISRYVQKGIKHYDDKEYKKALSFYNKVPLGDTNYGVALYEKALAFFKMEAYDSAIAACKEGVALKSSLIPDFFTCWASALNMKKEPQSALAVLDQGIKKYPYNNSLRKNKAIVYFSNDSINKAIETIEHAIDLNFIDPSNHVFLGKAYFAQGRTVPAIFAFTTALLFTTQGSVAQQSLAHLEYLTYRDFPKNQKHHLGDVPAEDMYFSELSKIIDSRIATDNGYKIPTKSKEPIIKQLYVLFSKFPYRAGDDFISRNYLPLYRGIDKSNHFEALSYFILQAYESEHVSKWISKHQRDINGMSLWIRERIDARRDKALAVVNGSEQEVSQWFYNSGSLYGYGMLNNEGENHGYWVFMNSQGSKASEGNFVNGKRDGIWRIYTVYNSISEIVAYTDDVLDGSYKSYFENGNIAYDVGYKNGKFHGVFKRFYTSGNIMSEEVYENGKLNGYASYYHKNGALRITGKYIDDLRDSIWTEYHVDGALSSSVNYVEGEMDGMVVVFFRNGNIESQGSYQKGTPIGEFKYYFDNKQLWYSIHFVDGKPEGTVVEYYDNGMVEEKYTISKGLREGKESYYDRDGVLWYDVDYKNNNMKSYAFYNKKGEVVHSDRVKGNTLELKYFYPEGNQSSFGLLSDNLKNGAWTYYHFNGNVSEVYNFKNGDYHGKYVYNYANGKKEIECTYNNGELDGLYKEYYSNDSLRIAGWYVNGKREGLWRSYYPHGMLSHEKYFLNGVLAGREINYHADGKKESEFVYADGMIRSIIFYDTLENPIDTCSVINGTGTYYLMYPNGKMSYTTNYRYGLFEGEAKAYYTDGVLFALGHNFNDEYSGRYKVYYHNGQIKHLAYFDNGQKKGDAVWYYDSGQIEIKGMYKNNKKEDTWKWFLENGNVDYEANFVDGENHGLAHVYMFGVHICTFEYKYDVVVAYSYKNKNGNLLPFAKLPENGTGEIVCKYPNANISFTQQYHKGLPHGNSVYYYDNGTVLSERCFKNGKKEGESKDYYKNGALKNERIYFYDKLHGTATYYYENGNVKKQEKYLFGEKHGEWMYFDENGKLLKTERYLYDEQYF